MTKRRLAVMAHYDPRGAIGPHVRRQALALATSVDEVVFVSTAPLTDDARTWFGRHGRLIERENVGYDFYSYKTGLDAADLAAYDEVIITNDTFVPVADYATVFDRMDAEPVDFWGLTRSERITPHLQSFFVAFRPWVVGSRTFGRFWGDMRPISDRWQVIKRYEVGMSGSLTDAGFAFAPYFSENDADRRLARRRVQWWAAHRDAIRGRADARVWRERAAEAWNPSVALADRALDGGRLPFVKIDTLRYDPYKLNSGRLLDLCEQTHPEAFDGVRGYLAETASFYPPRASEQLRPTPAALRPLRRTVEYTDDF